MVLFSPCEGSVSPCSPQLPAMPVPRVPTSHLGACPLSSSIVYGVLGAGGVQAELSGDSTLRLLPLREGEAREMVNSLRVKALLDGYRGAEPYDVEALVDAVEALAHMGATLGDRLEEAEINPLFVMPKGQGVAAADGLIVLNA